MITQIIELDGHQTRLDTFGSDHLLCRRLRTLAASQLSDMLDMYGQFDFHALCPDRSPFDVPVARKWHSKTLFGLTLGELLERDRRRFNATLKVPFILKFVSTLHTDDLV